MPVTEYWPILGFGGRPIANHVVVAAPSNRRLAVLFPGYGYSIDAPLFYYSARLLYSRGFDLLRLEYRYNADPATRSLSEQERDQWFAADVMGVYTELIRRKQYDQVLFVGKSLGTTGMLQISVRELPWPQSGYIWLSPGTAHSAIVKRLRFFRKPSLLVVGAADSSFDQTEIDSLSSFQQVRVRVVDGADHDLGFPNDVSRSIEQLKVVLAWIAEFTDLVFF